MTQRCFLKFKPIVFALLLCIFIEPIYASKKQDDSLSISQLRKMARGYMSFGEYEKAHSLASQALRLAQSQKTKSDEMALCLIDMGTVCNYEGLLTQAHQYLKKGAALQKQALTDNHPYVAHTLRMLSDVYLQQGDLEQAKTTLSQAVSIMLKQYDAESEEMAPFILQLADLRFSEGNLTQAYNNYEKALDIYKATYGEQHLMTANILEKMANLYIALEDTQKADELISESLKIKTGIYGRYHLQLVDTWLMLARLSKKQGNNARCEYYLAKSTEVASNEQNAIVMARIYEQINRI